MADIGLELVDHPEKNANVAQAADGTTPAESVDEFFNQIQSDMRRPDISQEAVAAAFQAIQRMALEGDAEKPMVPVTQSADGHCPGCGAENLENSKFCNGCGSPLQVATTDKTQAPGAGQHHYHHHYHHHYFPNTAGAPAAAERGARPLGAPVPIRDIARLRAPLTGPGVSRAEAALRKMTQDWVQACNTKQLDDLLELYVPDALVLRPNVPAVRGAAAIREFFFGALEAGLGEVELEPLRVELFGDIAYEAGRCKMLVPVAMGKRREERGKYLIIFNRQSGGDWKAVADTWSSDLNKRCCEATSQRRLVPTRIPRVFSVPAQAGPHCPSESHAFPGAWPLPDSVRDRR
jgi:ketosteroid isomerase-like protein